MKTFKNIVVATDFSDASLVAYQYAHRLANRFQASLKLVHAYQIFINAARPELNDYGPDPVELQKICEERMINFIKEAEGTPDSSTLVASRVKVTTEVRMGFAPDTLIEMSKDPSVDLMVLGTSGEKNWFDRLLGSVAVEVAREAYCPVLLVPMNADFKGIHNILYGASADSAKPKTLRLVADWAKYFTSKLHLVHVEASQTDDLKKSTQHFFDTYFGEYAPDLPYSMESVQSNSVMQGLWDYSTKKEVDLIVVVSHHRDFWASFNHHSVTKDLSLHTQLPILFLRSDVKGHPPV
jgi:nucleotide-binding universal stress UspA family protein